MKLFCISGQMRSGKNVTGDHISLKLGINTASFARPVKDIFCNTFGVGLDFVENWKVKEESPPGFNKPVRQSLQFIGDGFRSINPNVWVDYAFSNNPKDVCYTDGRYVNELNLVKTHGGFNVLLYRPSHENNDANESEAQIKRIVDWFVKNNIEGDVREHERNHVLGCDLVDFFLVNDGNLDDLYSKIDKIILSNFIFERKKCLT
jgi:hypothetical protein